MFLTSTRKPDGKCGTQNVIFRCKKCKAAKTIILDRFRRFQRTDKFGTPKYHYFTMLQDGRDPSAYERPVCCGRTMEWTEVKGTFSADHECGAKCLASKGPSCECSCGGANHGKGHV
jgi:hypothetical protein